MSEYRQWTLAGDPVPEETPSAEPERDESWSETRPELSIPVCCVDDCTTEVPGLHDGWDVSTRDGVACHDCWAFYRRHGHWPDDEPDAGVCVECSIDDGAVRHDCPEWGGDTGSVILEPGSECQHCGAVPDGTEVDGS